MKEKKVIVSLKAYQKHVTMMSKVVKNISRIFMRRVAILLGFWCGKTTTAYDSWL